MIGFQESGADAELLRQFSKLCDTRFRQHQWGVKISINDTSNASTAESPRWPWGEGVHERVPIPVSPSIQSRLVAIHLRWLVRPWMSSRTHVGLQRLLTVLLKWTLPTARGVTTQQFNFAELQCDCHTPSNTFDSEASIVYFHGAGYPFYSPDIHRSLTQLIALDSGLQVFVPSYRAAPEHPFSTQLDDAQNFVEALEQQGKDVRKMVFAGDSIGAHLALTVALARRDLGKTLPRSLVLISPCGDWMLQSLPIRNLDDLLPQGWVTWARDGYVDPKLGSLPIAPPINANLRRLPPVLIQSSSAEFFACDSNRLYWSLIGAEGLVTWQEWQGLWHRFYFNAALVPEGRAAVRRIARFIRACM